MSVAYELFLKTYHSDNIPYLCLDAVKSVLKVLFVPDGVVITCDIAKVYKSSYKVLNKR